MLAVPVRGGGELPARGEMGKSLAPFVFCVGAILFTSLLVALNFRSMRLLVFTVAGLTFFVWYPLGRLICLFAPNGLHRLNRLRDLVVFGGEMHSWRVIHGGMEGEINGVLPMRMTETEAERYALANAIALEKVES